MMLLVVMGYRLMPDSQDLREQAHAALVSKFLSGFHDAERIKDGASLPDVSILSSENRTVGVRDITKSRVTIVNFWASWCAPCLEELPSLAKFQLANPDILILPVSLDLQKTLPDLARLFDKPDLRDLRWFYDQNGVLRKSLNLSLYPTTYVLDRRGRIVYILQGPNNWASKDALNFGAFLVNQF